MEENEKPYLLELGKMEEILTLYPDNTFDAIVTDPPYGLKFMGKKWDYQVPSVEQWKEALRVLKPGGHLLCFGGSRTFHRVAVNIEDAGFEIRDTVMWLYGSGFPKSMDIGKAIDRAKGVRGQKIGERTFGKTSTGQSSGWNNNAVAASGKQDVFAPATDLAKQWEGWGTALKPAHEPIIVARKPLDGTVAANIEKWGTGGVNIDGCRIPMNGETTIRPMGGKTTNRLAYGKYAHDSAVHMEGGSETGRFPANVIHDGSEEVLALFPESKGQLGKASQSLAESKSKIYGKNKNYTNHPEPRSDSGSAARFFYCAKASKSDRGSDNDHPTVKPTELMRYLIKLITPPSGLVLDPFMGSGSTGKAAVMDGFVFVGIEMDQKYVDISRARIESVITEK